MSILTAFKIISSLIGILLGGILPNEILIESLESRTPQNKPIYNKISLKQIKDSDIWSMRQSHHGLNTDKWDHIEIRVNKSTSPYSVTYHQLENGKEVEYKADCLRCHSNGPRFIRPKEGIVKLTLKDKLQLLKWNMLIKSYGIMNYKENKISRRELVLHEMKPSIEFAKIKSCTQCHTKNGPRAPLSDQHKLTSEFLVRKGMMPPWPYKITKSDKRLLNKFHYGM